MKKLALCILLAALAATSAQAAGPYRNPDNKNPNDPLEGTYPVPYKLPVVAEITAQLDAVRGFIDRATPLYEQAGANLTINLTGAMWINFAAAYSDYHVSGLNPAGNACLADLAFVASRFRIVQRRRPAA